MKRYLHIRFASLLAFLFAGLGLEAASIEGVWRSDRHNIEIQVEKTYAGIKTKRFDQNEWFFYDKVGNDRYEDYRGNQYRFRGENELIWTSQGSNQKITFYKNYIRDDRNERYRERDRDRERERYKDRQRDRKRDDHWYDEDYDDDWVHDHYGSCDYTCREPSHRHRHVNVERAFRFLKGTWYNQRNGTKMKVKLEPSIIKVKVNRHWRIFYPNSRYSFSDDRGNRITILSDGRLRMKNRYGHRSSLYSKRRPVAYCY